MSWRSLVSLSLLVGSVAGCLLRLPVARGMELVEVVAKVERSVVRVDTDAGLGSGVIVDDRGFVLTNFHVIEGAKRAKISLRSGKHTAAQGFVVVDPSYDLALLRTDPFKEGSAIKIVDKMPSIGEKVAAFGNPKGFSFSTSEGIVSGIRGGRELIGIIGRDSYSALGYAADATWVQTTAPISPGNSGGPLVNMNAELVGLNTWSHIKGQNLNFAISRVDISRLLAIDLEKSSTHGFAELPKVRARPVAGAPERSDEIRLTLPNGRIFSTNVFLVNQSVLTNLDDDAGRVLIRHPNGALYAAASQKNGLLEGVTVGQWENQELMVFAMYTAGKRHGILKTWNEAGQPVLFAQYNQGKRHGFSCFFETGVLRLIAQYKADQIQWLQLMHNEDPLEGFGSRAEAEKNTIALELLEKLDECENTLKTNEIAFRKQVTEFEKARRRAVAAQLAPERRQRARERADQRDAEEAAFHGTLWRKFMGK